MNLILETKEEIKEDEPKEETKETIEEGTKEDIQENAPKEEEKEILKEETPKKNTFDNYYSMRQIPNFIYMVIRPQYNSMKPQFSNHLCFPITGLNITFNNVWSSYILQSK